MRLLTLHAVNILWPTNCQQCSLLHRFCTPLTPWGLFHYRFTSSSSQKYYLEIFVLQKLHFWWEFQTETLYVCLTPCFGRMYKFSSWNSHYKVISGIVYFSEIILESLRNMSETNPWHVNQMRGNLPTASFVGTEWILRQLHDEIWYMWFPYQMASK